MLKKIALLGFVSGFALYVYGRKALRRDVLIVDSDGEIIRTGRRRPF